MAEPTVPSPEWLWTANRLATIAHQLSSVAHEANNLLQVIAGSAEMIGLQAGATEVTQRRAATIAEHAHRVAALLGAVQEFGRAPDPDGHDTVSVRRVVSGALDLRHHALTRARIATALELPDEACQARASWSGVMQVVLNLLMNAEQALQGRADGRIRLTLSHAGREVVVRVEDNGPGFDPALVTPGQLGRSPAGLPKLGLGLLVADLVAAREGGRLEVVSAGGGTTATLTLPSV